MPLDDIRDVLYDETLEKLKTDHYNSELESWISALNPKYDLSAFKFTTED